MRHNPISRISAVNRRLENLHALSRNFRTAQTPYQLLALARKHWPDDDLNPTHVALDDIHAASRGALIRMKQPLCKSYREITFRRQCSRDALCACTYRALLKNGANALMIATRNASCLVIRFFVS